MEECKKQFLSRNFNMNKIKLVLLTSFAFAFIEAKKTIPWEPTAKEHDWWKERHAEMLKISKAEASTIKIVFIGSSSMDYWRSNGKPIWDKEYAPLGAVNFGIRGDQTQNVLWRINDGLLDGLNPKLFVVYVGGNNLPRHDEENTVKGIVAVMDKLNEKFPQAKLIYVGIFPSGRKPIKESLEKKRRVAEKLKEVFKEKNEKWNQPKFFDEMFFLLAPESMEKINEEFYVDDKIHLNLEGYRLWSERMNETFYSMI